MFRKALKIVLLAGIVISSSCKEKSIRLAMISGMNEKLDTALYAPLLESLENITWKVYNNRESQELFKPENTDKYDVILFYDICLEEFPEASRQNLIKAVSGGKPVFILHDGLLTYNTWPEFAKIAGIKYFMSHQDVDGVEYGVSKYKHDVDIPVKVVDKKHFITQGIDESFLLHDEIYGKMWSSPEIHPLLVTDHPDSDPVIMYTHQYGKGKIVGIVPGHGPGIFRDKNFRIAFQRAILWLGR
ncbi:MAG: ThuA domain-containing protein [Bacteroidales bacterium]|jgi:type 1 glutamine amidotransferase|nr:ThuA domain-containing protein [Bacteroidales bacterium]